MPPLRFLNHKAVMASKWLHGSRPWRLELFLSSALNPGRVCVLSAASRNFISNISSCRGHFKYYCLIIPFWMNTIKSMWLNCNEYTALSIRIMRLISVLHTTWLILTNCCILLKNKKKIVIYFVYLHVLQQRINYWVAHCVNIQLENSDGMIL